MQTIKHGKWGMWLSGLCAVHCLLMPLAAVSMPLIGVKMLHHPLMEFSLMGGSFLFAFSATLRSYFNVHRNIATVLLTLAGFVFIITGHIMHESIAGISLTLIGACLVIFSLYKNNRLVKGCRHSVA